MEHAYWAVRCVNCDLNLLLKDLGPNHPDWMPVLEAKEFAVPFEVRCEDCGQTHTYSRMQVMPVRQEPPARKAS